MGWLLAAGMVLTGLSPEVGGAESGRGTIVLRNYGAEEASEGGAGLIRW